MEKSQMKDICRWLISNGIHGCGDKKGRIKLQKMLYFSQLISLAKYGEPLFNEEIVACEHGSVVESARLLYNSGSLFNTDFKNLNLSEEQLKVLNLTNNIFGHVSSEELEEINHLHVSWQNAFARWVNNGKKSSDNSNVISKENLILNEVGLIKKVLDSYEQNQENTNKTLDFEGVKFFYDPNEVSSDEIKNYLFEATKEGIVFDEEESYVVSRYSGIGLVIN